jgi:predicted 3-demethylubiquinone-9 3-methyltransferase (glyoxalase superfamily)
MPKQIPCLWFDGQAEQAAQHYSAIFPNSGIDGVTRYGPDTPGEEGAVMTVEFRLDGQPYVGLNGGPQFTFSEAISFQIPCKDQEEVDRYWDALSEGGEKGPCGWLKDRFGVSWQIVPTRLVELLSDPDRERSQRVMACMMKMGKIEIAELEQAAAA